MIHFFRKIRQNLLLEGKTRKYIKYAFGEIVLVMVGILLALQVTNWNNQRLERLREQAILKNLQIDFQNNISNLETASASFEVAYQASVDLLEIIKGDQQINPEEVDHLVDIIVNKTMSYDLITGSINEIFNTGSLNLIQDSALKKQISNWSFYYSDTEDDIVIYRDYLFSFLVPSLTDKVRMRNMSVPDFFEEGLDLPPISKSEFQVNYEQTIRTFEFENEVYNNALNYMYVLNSYKVFQNYLTETLALIDKNIH
ncbi:hypothetical protein [Algoriphagus halophilus]|uniref:Uncharacterized protein n=1 Tax=Algoriphagus halophilus TaxID=226505 RepID=A0A1N6DA68_9BACT|nr:hypothetical protein [Algoriphagus halophilus]SIN67695.1 hypothetical protein SAMN05444394_0587 [Algoriphagus halophilus]